MSALNMALGAFVDGAFINRIFEAISRVLKMLVLRIHHSLMDLNSAEKWNSSMRCVVASSRFYDFCVETLAIMMEPGTGWDC